MFRFKRISMNAALAALLIAAAPVAADDQFSGFLSDYTQLEAVPDYPGDLFYLAPGALEQLGQYNAIMVDQPEIFIAPDSSYRGMKPDDMKALSDAFREKIIDTLSETYRVVETPGPDVLYVRVAITNLHLKKKRRVIDFTPVGVLKNTAKAIFISDITKKLSLIEVTVESELIDSQTGERLAAVVEQRGQAKDKEAGIKQDAASWDELEATLQAYAKRLLCRMDNARVPEEQRTDCRSIT